MKTKTFNKTEKPKAKSITFDFHGNENEALVSDFFTKYDGILSSINILLYMSKTDLYGTGKGYLPVGRLIEFATDEDGGFIVTAVVYGNYVEKIDLTKVVEIRTYTSNDNEIIDKFVLVDKEEN